MNPAFLTDRYQLTMLAAYARSGYAKRRAVFELFVRRLPPQRRFMVACGVGRALEQLSRIRFYPSDIEHLEKDSYLGPAFANPAVRELFENFSFNAKVYAIPEGRLCFPNQPLVRVEGTLAEAQLVETLLLSIVNHDTRVASKCARITHAAAGRPCFEFGTRRTHECAAIDAARSAYIAGFSSTSNEQAAKRYGIPISGTMAHSFILAHAADFGEEGEGPAFADFAATFDSPSTCLVDSFDTLRGVERAAHALGPQLGAVRIDSGDLAALARGSREILDRLGRTNSKVVLSDDLDEYKIEALLAAGAPVDAFGVGTMAVSTPDAPSLGAVYKLVALEDKSGNMCAVQKRAPGKGSAAAPKQVFRKVGTIEDTLALKGESLDGEPLVVPVFENGEIIIDTTIAAARARFTKDWGLASQSLKSIAPRKDGEGFPCSVSPTLSALHAQVERDGRMVLDNV